MMRFTGFNSSFGTSDQRHYSEGGCHEFAIALHQMFPEQFQFMVVTSDDEPGGTDDNGEDIPIVIHVMVQDKQTGICHDVFGSCPDDQVKEWVEQHLPDLRCEISDAVPHDMESLSYFIDVNDDGSRPLSAITEDNVKKAMCSIRPVARIAIAEPTRADRPKPVLQSSSPSP